MHKIALFFESQAGKSVKNGLIGIGASIVIVGALFKLQHWPGASIMLIIGLSIEALIFFVQGVLPPHKDYYWEKLYPGIEKSPDLDGGFTTPETTTGGNSDLSAIGDQLSAVSKNLELLNNAYQNELGQTKSHTDQLNTFYSNLAESAKNLEETKEITEHYKNGVAKLASNIDSLNEVYGNMLVAMKGNSNS